VPGDFDALPWRQVIGGVFEVALACGTARYRASLLRIEVGRKIPRHTHRGGEHTLVLDGAFRDAFGTCARGDVSMADDSIDHSRSRTATHRACVSSPRDRCG
jgi:putative transcriptional regulator